MKDSAKEYRRNVMAHLVSINNEDDAVLKDISGVGIEADIRRAAIDGVITDMWDKNMHDFCKAMQIAHVSALQAAQVISALTMIQERSK